MGNSIYQELELFSYENILKRLKIFRQKKEDLQEVKNVLKGTNGGKCVLMHQNVKYSGEKNLEKVI